jgi:hypothetical protein
MKPLLLISTITVAFFACTMGVLAAIGVRFNPVEPITAAFIAAGAGAVGIFPPLAGKRRDAVGAFQLALVGTVLHLLAAVGLTAAALATHLVSPKMSFISWMLAGYWVSLVGLVWQLRKLLLATFGLTKVTH